ncbi:unnamed protein product [Cochlearia groenlandica]
MEIQQQQRPRVMTTLNDLPDELVLKILSLLPFYKETTSSQLVTQRWRDPYWNQTMTMPRVYINNIDQKRSIMRFIYGSLLSNYAHPLEKLHLNLRKNHSDSNIDFLVETAVNRSLRKLWIHLRGKTLTLPSRLATCITLKSLVLSDLTLKCVPSTFTLPSLKSLHLYSVKPSNLFDSLNLLHVCPVLEYLVLYRTHIDEVTANVDNVLVFEIDVPTLKSLSIVSKGKHLFREYDDEIQGFMIKAPSLRSLYFKDTTSNFLVFDQYMPELTKADIEINWEQSEMFLGSLISIQHLSLCAPTAEIPYPTATYFFFLEHLELCICSARWANLLACILSDAPRLQSLKLVNSRHSKRHNGSLSTSKPTVVPECLSNRLEILEWRQYDGTWQEMEVAAYILANSKCLKMATFLSPFKINYIALKNMPRVSEMCKLVFE